MNRKLRRKGSKVRHAALSLLVAGAIAVGNVPIISAGTDTTAGDLIIQGGGGGGGGGNVSCSGVTGGGGGGGGGYIAYNSGTIEACDVEGGGSGGAFGGYNYGDYIESNGGYGNIAGSHGGNSDYGSKGGIGGRSGNFEAGDSINVIELSDFPSGITTFVEKGRAGSNGGHYYNDNIYYGGNGGNGGDACATAGDLILNSLTLISGEDGQSSSYRPSFTKSNTVKDLLNTINDLNLTVDYNSTNNIITVTGTLMQNEVDNLNGISLHIPPETTIDWQASVIRDCNGYNPQILNLYGDGLFLMSGGMLKMTCGGDCIYKDDYDNYYDEYYYNHAYYNHQSYGTKTVSLNERVTFILDGGSVINTCPFGISIGVYHYSNYIYKSGTLEGNTIGGINGIGGSASFHADILDAKEINLYQTFPGYTQQSGSVDFSVNTLKVKKGYEMNISGVPDITISGYEFDITGAVKNDTLLSVSGGIVDISEMQNDDINIVGIPKLSNGENVILINNATGALNIRKNINGNIYSIFMEGDNLIAKLIYAFDSSLEIKGLALVYPNGAIETIPYEDKAFNFSDVEMFYPALSNKETNNNVHVIKHGDEIKGYIITKNKSIKLFG